MRRFGRLTIALLLSFGAALAPVSEAVADSRIKAAIIVDANTNNVLYSSSADVLRSPASLTKIMTLYVLFAYMRAASSRPTPSSRSRPTRPPRRRPSLASSPAPPSRWTMPSRPW
ncbi:hypothetical protein AUC71_09355 [Methyloceanibacter marginalis]|uniref:Peptidase S11 D-alanyl-D-alanine carboxypeptidase A N-terminal domain-containing protein n=1 Tax=Methyloceanibacter marginalis TaxID=1774971 RepID=A0A1E3WCG4_9HYPH|nr:hypothetical protein [Methyloceanibacter marginalis]ODS03513.1 hypothetical protein AUC71_09355 [Methyloceanibacter marginalis]